ncbi:MAG TPA: multicopper oxidase domain-containing protein [Arenibaculum sp.]|nr:multicopper oxidase domain-containing protein [Arenibaculum sp.]
MNPTNRPTLRRHELPAAAMMMMLLLTTGAAPAQENSLRTFSNPPVARPVQPPGAPAAAPMAVTPERDRQAAVPDSREVIEYDFDIRFTRGQVYNPWTLSNDAVELRSYRGTDVDPAVPFMAPTVTMRPGQTVRITLDNDLPAEPGCETNILSINVPHCFNTTNLHSHGLWVSPTGNSDNVLVAIKPGVEFQYEYNVPEDHAAGTFWYHPHTHGSTALQVSSGMAGALVVKAEREPTETRPGDVDILLKEPDGRPFAEKIILLQQMQYACRDADGNIETAPSGTPWTCPPGSGVGAISGYDQFGPSTEWAESGRFTSINGRVQPELSDVTAGRFERWRLVHAGVRETVKLQFFRLAGTAPDFRTVPAAGQRAWIDANCVGDALPSWEIALDGLTRAQVRTTTQTVLQPGYRVDLLTFFPDAGQYCVLDGDSTASGSVGGTDEGVQLLGVVTAGPGPEPDGSPEDLLERMLVSAAEKALSSPGQTAIRDKVVADLTDGLKLDSFVWHRTIDEDEVTGTQELAFDIVLDPSGNAVFQVDGRSYDPARVDRELPLGGVDEWTLVSDFVSHPFHIHVNPFQIVSILDPDGKDVSLPDAVDDATLPGTPAGPPDPQYPGLQGVWKDTLWIKNLVGTFGADPAPGRYTITVRTRYQRYIGEFVLHCHILDHEDQGMMQNVRISVPDGRGGFAHGHH